MTTVNNPFPYFPEAGTNGYIYIGSANQDAQTNPIVAYRDAELTAPWSQPIRTVNGYAAYQGAKAGIFLGVSEFSITVKDSNGVIVLNDNAAQRFLNYDDLTSATSTYARLQYAGGASPFAKCANGVMVHVGDSTLLGASEWGVAYKADWLGVGGIFEGWTSYNLAKNGSPVSTWVASIATGDRNAAPVDYTGTGNPAENVWQAVNANPDIIVIGILTNDLRLTGAQDDTQFAATLATARTNYKALIDFFLENTTAEIWLRMNAPICYANPDPGGFTNFTTADRAARAAAGIRTLNLEWLNVSNRVKVWDTHAALFGTRIDSVPSAVDPEGQIAFNSGGVNYGLMKDTLHPTGLGWTRVCQYISRTIDSSRPRTTEVITPAAIVRNGAIASMLVEIKAVGAGYIDVYANTIARRAGDLNRNQGRAPVNNIKLAETLLATGYASDLQNMLRSGSLLFTGNSGGTAGSAAAGFTWAYTAVDGITDYIRISGATPGTLTAGWAMLYVTSASNLPRYPALQEPITIPIGGAVPLTSGAASGAVPIPSLSAFPTIDVNTVSATRRNSSGAATIDLYLCNRFDGAYVNPSGGAVLSAAPGHRLGQITFPNGHLGVTSWAKDNTNYPSGNPVPVYALNSNTFIAAVLTSGGLGDQGSVMIRAG